MPKKIKLFILALSCLANILSPFLFKINQVECILGETRCPEELTIALQQLQGRSLFFTAFDTMLSENPALLGYRLSALDKRLNGQVTLYLQRLPTAFAVQFGEGSERYRLFSNGQLVLLEKHISQDGLLTIKNQLDRKSTSQELALEPELAGRLIAFFEHWNRSELQNQSSQFTLYSEDTLVVSLENGRVALIDLAQAATSIARLQLLLSSLDLNGIDLSIKEIDVRYRLPVLRTKYSISLVWPHQLLLDSTPSSLLC